MRSKIHSIFVVMAMVTAVSLLIVHAQQQPKTGSDNMNGMPGMSSDEMNKRGDKVMGFDHTKTTHHFGLSQTGGTIEVAANTIEDIESRDQIRKHLGHIARMFAAGNFNAPMLIHDQNPPGVYVLQRLKNEIEYKFEETERGAMVRVSTKNPEALQAIYNFLRFQIKEHKTGDSLEISGE